MTYPSRVIANPCQTNCIASRAHNSSFKAAASTLVQLAVAEVSIGPCGWVPIHRHVYADEAFIVVKGLSHAIIISPNNTLIKINLTVGDGVTFPMGWVGSHNSWSMSQMD